MSENGEILDPSLACNLDSDNAAGISIGLAFEL